MKRLKTELLAFAFLLTWGGLSQELSAQHRVCGSDQLHEQAMQDAHYRQEMDRAEAGYQAFVNGPQAGKVNGSVRTIPVVIHFIQSSDIELVSDAEAQSQIDILNEDYRRMAGTPGFGAGVDCEYQFCLASIDPDGCPTTGINRVVAPQWAYHDQADGAQMKGLIQWDPHRYLNMWVPRTIETTQSGGGQVIGYATFPYNLNLAPNLDGVVIHSNFLGRQDQSYQGRTGTHEVGHWLGLFHTFQNACQGATAATCASNGDRVCDTPQAADANFGCPSLNSCTDSPTDLPDQIENYMDYSDGICQNMFTQGQKTRMDYYSNTSRSLLWSASNLTFTGCDGTLSAGCTPNTNFVANVVYACPGVPIQLTDLSLHTPTSWSWDLTGGTPATSTQQNPTVTYAAAGSYAVALTATNGNGSGTETKFAYIEVMEPDSNPLQEGFEGILSLPQAWVIHDNSGINTWQLATNARSEGQNSMKVKNFEARNAGESMMLESPSFTLATFGTGYLTFDYSYKKFSGLTTDGLKVRISTDCGNTWTIVWDKSGPYLATVAGNASTTEWVPSTAAHWKSDTVSLDSFSGQPSVKVQFMVVSQGGQSVYIDNINMTQLTVSAAEPAHLGWGFQVSPNPFRDELHLSYDLGKSEAVNFVLTDLSGKVLYNYISGKQAPGRHDLALSPEAYRNLPAGIYFLKGETANGSATKKLLKVD
jgi:PKD repeat protein